MIVADCHLRYINGTMNLSLSLNTGSNDNGHVPS